MLFFATGFGILSVDLRYNTVLRSCDGLRFGEIWGGVNIFCMGDGHGSLGASGWVIVDKVSIF